VVVAIGETGGVAVGWAAGGVVDAEERGAAPAGIATAEAPAAPVCGAGVVGAAALLQPRTALKPIHAQALPRTGFLRVFMSILSSESRDPA